MSKYRKPFLKRLTQTLAKRFPDWRLGLCAPVFYARPDCTFSDAGSYSRCGLYFHLIVNFTPKWEGAFTGDIIIASSVDGFADNRNAPPRWDEHIPQLLEGCYRIGWFFAGRDLWWHLVDEEAESRLFWEKRPPLPGGAPILKRHKGDWYASRYDVPLSDVILEAANHFSDMFEQHVIPKLRKNA